jgi:hypothetical protein
MGLNNNKKPVKKAEKKASVITVSDAVGNYEKHPFFVKKTNAAKSYLSKVGLPEQLKVKARG